MNLMRDEICALQKALVKAWVGKSWQHIGCPFAFTHGGGNLCNYICAALFPRILNNTTTVCHCPAECGWGGRYGDWFITRQVEDLLSSQSRLWRILVRVKRIVVQWL